MSVSLANNAYAAAIIARALEAARTPDEFKVAPKVFYHTHNGAKFHIDLGPGRVKTIAFINHKYVTDDKREIDQLELVADTPGTFIYTLPDSDAAKIMQEELAKEARTDIMKTAQAQAAVHGQQFDPNTPVVPVATHASVTVPLAAAPYVPPNTGMQNSFSGTVPGAPELPLTKPEDQTAPPASAALAALAKLTADAKSAAAT
ncbi:MAG: hypothetical protein E6Q97_33340 [Desulfurellales bacterium]|nr:MAG: hypothetical protein E6Q97_33340 [Desulfurellales bacterium]